MDLYVTKNWLFRRNFEYDQKFTLRILFKTILKIDQNYRNVLRTTTNGEKIQIEKYRM